MEYIKSNNLPLTVEQFSFSVLQHGSSKKQHKVKFLGKPIENQTESHSQTILGEQSTKTVEAENERGEGILYVDPRLPKGWKREIRHQPCGRIEVYIESPDGRKFRRRQQLALYLRQMNLPHYAEDFDFSLVGKSSATGENDLFSLSSHVLKVAQTLKKKRCDNVTKKITKKLKTDPTSDKKVVAKVVKKEQVECIVGEELAPVTREEAAEYYRKITSITPLTVSHKCNDNQARCDGPTFSAYDLVRGYALSANLGDERSERRQSFGFNTLNCSVSQVDATAETIPIDWVTSLANCRPGTVPLEHDAASSIATATELFIKRLAFLSLEEGDGHDLTYNHIAQLIVDTPSLMPLRSLIPHKITFRQYRLMNRPTKYFSFKV